MERYKRHHLLREIGTEGQKKLLNSRVLLVGVGGLGSPIALYLTAAGVGRIGLMDDDVVSISNLQRQVLYSETELGERKVDCAKRRLLQQCSSTCIDTYPYRLTNQNATSIVSDYDIVIDGCDNFATRYLINDTCLALGKPYIYGSIGEFTGQVAVFNYLGGIDYRALFSEEETLTRAQNTEEGVMGVVPGVVGCLEAAEAIKIITGCGNVLRNKLLTIDLLTMRTEVYHLGD